MVPVITQFMADIEKDEETAGHADCKTGNVDKRISFMPLEISQSDLQIILYHPICMQKAFIYYDALKPKKVYLKNNKWELANLRRDFGL